MAATRKPLLHLPQIEPARIRQHDDAFRRRRFLRRIAVASADAIEPVQRRRAEHDRAHVPLDHVRIELPFVAGDLGAASRSVRQRDVDRVALRRELARFELGDERLRLRDADSRATRCRRARRSARAARTRATRGCDDTRRTAGANASAAARPRHDRARSARTGSRIRTARSGMASAACRKHSRSARADRAAILSPSIERRPRGRPARGRPASCKVSPCACSVPSPFRCCSRSLLVRVRQQGRSRQADPVDAAAADDDTGRHAAPDAHAKPAQDSGGH